MNTQTVSKYSETLLNNLNARVAEETKKREVNPKSQTPEKFEKLRNRLTALVDTLEAFNVDSTFIKTHAIYVCDKIVATAESLKLNRAISDAHIKALMKNAVALKDSDIEFDYNLLRAMCSKNCDHGLAKKLKYRNESYDAATASTQSSYAKTTLVTFGIAKEDKTRNLEAKNTSRNKIVINYESEAFIKLAELCK